MTTPIKPISPIRPAKQILRDAFKGVKKPLKPKSTGSSETLPPAVKVTLGATPPPISIYSPPTKIRR